jgi:hypothetical protein
LNDCARPSLPTRGQKAFVSILRRGSFALDAPADSHADIEDWIRRVMPDLHPIVKGLDELSCETIPGL